MDAQTSARHRHCDLKATMNENWGIYASVHDTIMADYTSKFQLHLPNSFCQATFLPSDHGPRHAGAIIFFTLAGVVFELLRLLRCHLLRWLRCRVTDKEVGQVVACLC